MQFLTHCEDCQRDSESETERSWCAICGSVAVCNTKIGSGDTETEKRI
jgi:rRNA maturation endonuclease Nob1